MITKEQLLDQLQLLKVPSDKPVIVHTSLKSIGVIEGGAETLLDALIEHITSDGGLLCIPTHTWANYERGDEIVLDLVNPKTCIGAFPEYAIKDGRGVTSENPTHSLTVFGERKKVLDFISADDNVLTPTSPFGCYGRAGDMDGFVLLLGVGQDKNTYMHSVEEFLNLPYRISDLPVNMKIRRKDGSVLTKKFCYMRTDVIYDVSMFFPKYTPAFEYCGAVRYGKIGNAKSSIVSMNLIKEVMIKVYNRSGGVELLSDDKPLNENFYK